MGYLEQLLAGLPVIKLGILASMVASVGTAIGALPVLASPKLSRRAQSLMVSAAAGVMLAATFFSLLSPGLEAAEARVANHALATLFLGLSIIVGALVVLGLNRWAPHEHEHFGEDPPRTRGAWLFVMAITLHHFPEGIAVGVGFGGSLANGVALTTAILFQNLPEGFIVGMALLAQGFGRGRSFAIASATGLAQLFGGVVGAIAISMARTALPWAMGFAAGAMLFVITHEMLAQTYREEQRGGEATLAILAGFVGMMVLEAALP